MPLLSWVVSNVMLALVLGLVAWFVQRRLARPALAHFLWVLVLVKLVTPPLVTVPLGQSSGPMACTLGTCGCDHQTPEQSFVRDTLPWLLPATWAVGAGTMVWLARRRWARFHRLLAHARPAPPEWQSLAERLSSELAIRNSPEVLAVPGRLPPLVVPGWLRPRVLLPTALLGQLEDSQRRALLLHELAHIQRGDHWVRLLEFVVGVAYWWLPVGGVIGRQLRGCEETCCDAAVVGQLPDARREYARLLLDVIDFTDPPAEQAVPQATAMSAANDLEARLRAILDSAPGARRTWVTWVFALGLACAILPCQLQYDFAARSIPDASTLEQEPGAGETCPDEDRVQRETFKMICCPT